MSKQLEDCVDLKNLGEFENADCLTLSEVYFLLKEKMESMKQEAIEEVEIGGIGNEKKSVVLSDVQSYVQHFGKFNNNKEVVKDIRNMLQKHQDIHQFELCKMTDLCPEEVEEATTLIQSLKSKDPDAVQEIIDAIRNNSI